MDLKTKEEVEFYDLGLLNEALVRTKEAPDIQT